MYKFALLACLALSAAGQAPAPAWDRVRAITPGTEVRIAAENTQPIRGKLDSVTDTTLFLLPKGAPSVDRPQILNVSAKTKGHRLRNTFIGLGVGLGAGIAVGAVAASNCKGLLCEYNVAVGAGLGLIVGTAAGAVWPTGGWREIYRR